MTSLLHTPLFTFHAAQGAKFAAFAGYEMPIQYPLGVKGEHLHTRAQAGLFDVSHMGQLWVRGPQATEALERVVPAALREMQTGQIRYSQLTLENGGILDDLMLTKCSDDAWFLVVNGACKHADFAHLQAQLPDSLSLQPLPEQALIAIQGPSARDALATVIPESAALPFMTARTCQWRGTEILVSCCGYTGEDGFEVSLPAALAMDFAEVLTALNATTWVGLGARNSLRLEAGLCLYGHDITTDTTPVEADLLWSIQARRRIEGGFLGAEVIQAQIAQGATRKRVGIRPDDGKTPLRDDTLLVSLSGEPIGQITSGGFGPSVAGPVAMGYVDAAHQQAETPIIAHVRGRSLPCRVTSAVFFPPRYRRTL
ncbi:MAG: glycine cleavage system aminomethyltransferase GcvT [Gammaproteobacteria bacterium]|nr:glycine cleavage system aminomethyltransferase GcvT [Gammaproteobacteria bacterium]